MKVLKTAVTIGFVVAGIASFYGSGMSFYEARNVDSRTNWERVQDKFAEVQRPINVNDLIEIRDEEWADIRLYATKGISYAGLALIALTSAFISDKRRN